MTPARYRGPLWLLVFAPTLLVFLTTAHWYGWWSADTTAAHWGGWALVHGYGNDLTGLPGLPPNDFINAVDSRLVVERTGGVVLAGAPLQLLLRPLHLAPDTVGVLTAVLLSAAAIANVAVLLERMTGSRRRAVLGAGLLAFGTPVWTVCSAELWTHTPNAFWLSCLLLAAQRGAWGWAGLASIPLVWTRPHLVLAVAGLAAWVSWSSRRIRPLATVGAACAAALATLVAWNGWMFDRPSVTAPYGRLVEAARDDPDLVGTVVNGLGVFLSPSRGVFLYTPLAALALYATARCWRSLPAWSQGALLGGFAYQAAQVLLNRFVGGGAFYGNRLAVELLVLGTPAAALALVQLVRERPGTASLVPVLSAASVATHAIGALLAGTAPVLEIPEHPWREWMLLRAVQAGNGRGIAVATVAVAVAAWTAFLMTRRGATALSPAGQPSARRTDL
jgi:alpha-1,2-mannosyltransferase